MTLFRSRLLFGCVTAIEVVLFLIFYLSKNDETMFVALAILLSLPMLLFLWKFFEASFVLFITLLFGFYDIFGKFPLILSPVNIYLGDGILIFIVILILKLLVADKLGLIKSPISSLLLINFAVGIVFLVSAYIFFDISFNNMFGAFRRYYIYPLSAFVSIYYVNTARNSLGKLKNPFVLILAFIILLVIYRVMSNQSWWGDYYGATGDSRAIGYFTGIILLMGFTITYGYALLANSPKFYVISAVIFLSILAANWRLLWFFAFLLPFYVPYLLSKKTSVLISRLFITLPAIAALSGLSAYLFKILLPNWYGLIMNSVLTKVIEYDISGDIRYWMWQSAILKFREAPFWGYGLGEDFDFWGINSLGQYVVFNLGTHNIIFDLLYQVGLFGIWIFLLFHCFIVVYVIKRLFSLPAMQRLIIGTLFIGYLGELGASMLQSTLRAPSDAVAFYLIVGFLVQYTYKFNRVRLPKVNGNPIN